MKQKKIVLLAAMAAAICLMGILWLVSKPPVSEGTKEITVTVVHKDGSEVSFACATEEAYLAPVLLEEGIVQGQYSTYGLMIQAADGETADWDTDQSYWALYVNGEYATTGAESTPVTQGGQYHLVYTHG